MNNVSFIPRGAKETISVLKPKESCFTLKQSSKRPKRVKNKKVHFKENVVVDTNDNNDDNDLNLLINTDKKKTQDQLNKDADEKYVNDDNNMFKIDTKNHSDESDFDDDMSGSDLDDDISDSESTDNEIIVNENNQISRELVTHEQMIKRKARILAKLERRVRFTGASIEFNSRMSLEELEVVEAKWAYQSNSDVSVQIMRRMLMFTVATFEAISKNMPFLQLDLDEWSNTVFLQLNQYDEILFEIYDFYASDFEVNPLLKLGVAIITNALMHSFSRKMLQRVAQSATPNMQNVRQAYSPPQSTVNTDVNDEDEVSNDIMSGPDDGNQQAELLNMLRSEQQDSGKSQEGTKQTKKSDIKEVHIQGTGKKQRLKKNVLSI